MTLYNVNGNISSLLENVMFKVLRLSNMTLDSETNLSQNISDIDTVSLDNISGNISSLLENVEYYKLYLSNMRLDSETTRSLVNCTTPNVKKRIWLGRDGLVTLNMDVLTEYNWDGTRHIISGCNKTRKKYPTRMTTRAKLKFGSSASGFIDIYTVKVGCLRNVKGSQEG